MNLTQFLHLLITISNFGVIFTSIESQIIQRNDNYHKRFKHTCGFFFT